MDNRSTGISAYQLGIFLIVTMVGVGILTLPREVVEIADTDGWMLVLSSGVLTMGSVSYTHLDVYKRQSLPP